MKQNSIVWSLIMHTLLRIALILELFLKVLMACILSIYHAYYTYNTDLGQSAPPKGARKIN